MKKRFKCTDVNYRQGFVEVAAGVHAQHVNLEIWNIHPDTEISDSPLELLPEESVVANTEIELNIVQARALIAALENAIHELERDVRS